MSALVLPLAHHGLVAALPFVVPMLLVFAGLLFLVARDRLGGAGEAAEREEAPHSSA